MFLNEYVHPNPHAGSFRGPRADYTKIAEDFDPYSPLTEIEFCRWIANAIKDDSIVYYRGHLLRDRSETLSTLDKYNRQRVNALARRAWIACEMGLIHLFSERIDDNDYRYIAKKTRYGITNLLFKEV